ncbi:MAG: hypothetical protein AAB339_01930 [Elusimicrobiota bacterium]
MLQPRAALILLAASLLCACGPSREKEPNDEQGSATRIKPGKTQGTVAGPGDKDIYRLVVRKEGLLSVRVGGIRGVDFVLSVRAGDGREFKRYDETGEGGDEQALDLWAPEGDCFIELSNKSPKAGSSQAYTLETAIESPAGREREPDDSPQTASPMELPGLTRGHFHPARNLLSGDTEYAEADWYRMEVQTPGLSLLNLSVGGVPGVDFSIEVYDLNAYKIRESDTGGAGEGESLKGFGVRGPARYFLRLAAKRRTGTPLKPYEMLSELLPYQGKSEFEPNEQRQDATPFIAESVTGTISPEGDQDWFLLSVEGDSKQVLRAGLEGPDSMDLELTLRDSLGIPLARVDNMGKGKPETLTGFGVVKGDYFLSVSEKTGKKSDGRQGYTLSRQLAPFQEGLEFEANDSTSSAQPLKVGESVDGFIAPKSDEDWYEFNVYSKGEVLLDLAGVVNVRFTAALFDQEYAELQSWTAEKNGGSLSFVRELEPGTYFLRIKAADPAQNNVRDKYTLRVKTR